MIRAIKKYISIAVTIVIIILTVFTYVLYQRNIDLKDKISVSKANEKAFLIENSGLKDQNRVFQFTVDQLNFFSDSLVEEMNNVRKELKVKDKELKQMQYLLSVSNKADTIVFRDTLFKESLIRVDTLLSDDWYKLKLSLIYPNTIIANPEFISKKYIVVNSKRETIEPPKKFFLARWFQKRHITLIVNVVEKSPYIINEQQRFIEVLR